MQTLIDGVGLDVAFQPIVDLASGRVVGAEALARFTDADGNADPDRALLPRRPRRRHGRASSSSP